MRVLVACERFGHVRDAFIAKGHDAWSCDLASADGHHIQDDVLNHLNDGWGAMIAFPDCTYLTISANRWYKDQPQPKSGILVGNKRKEARHNAITFFLILANCKIKKKAIENPIGIMSTVWRKPDQIIHPYMFGHMEQKPTCLWLENLPVLVEENNVYKEMMKLSRKERERIHYMTPSKDRGIKRSETFLGIANAMANQWG
jgi:hypothetical protein